MNLLVEFGRPISFLIIVVIIPFLYVLFSDKAIKALVKTAIEFNSDGKNSTR